MCTNFSITSKENEPFIGRTMELGPNLGSELFFRPKGYEFTQKIEESTLSYLLKQEEYGIEPLENLESITGVASWVGKYGFVAMNAFGQDISADGMNTEGLVTGCMVLTASEYQEIPERFRNGEEVSDEESNMIYYTNLSNWILSSCATCQDVINGLVDVKLVKPADSTLKERQDLGKKYIVTTPFSKVPNAFKFHFPVHDAQGNNIVLEYIKGELTITDLAPINVLTNDPEISWQQTNVLNNYVGVTPYNYQDDCGYSISIAPEAKKGKDGKDTCELEEKQNPKTAPPVFNCNSFAQGTGFDSVPGSSTPVDRFVRAAMMTNFAFKTSRREDCSGVADPVTTAFHILNTVDIPMGTSRDPANWNDPVSGVHDYTQWSTVSDLKKTEYSIRMYGSPQVFLVKLGELNLEKLVDTHLSIPTENKSINLISEALVPLAFSPLP